MSETNYAKQIQPKELLVIDECHNLYQELSDFIYVSITSNMLELINLNFPDNFNEYSNKNKIVDWIRNTFLKKLNDVKFKITNKIDNEISNLNTSVDKSQLKDELLQLDNMNSDSDSEVDSNEINEILSKYQSQNENKTLTKFIKHNETLSKVKSNIVRFLEFYESDNWVINYHYEKKEMKEEIIDDYDDYENYGFNNEKKKKTMKVKSIESYFTNIEPKNKTENKIKDDIKTISLKKKKYRKVFKDVLTKIEFKPVDISKYSKQLLYDYGYRVLLMSATILNKPKFCDLIGLQNKDVSFINIPSPFPPENKPIMYCPVGNMGLQSIEDNFPKLIKNINKILKIHKKDKGIIHCHSYKISNYIKRKY